MLQRVFAVFKLFRYRVNSSSNFAAVTFFTVFKLSRHRVNAASVELEMACKVSWYFCGSGHVIIIREQHHKRRKSERLYPLKQSHFTSLMIWSHSIYGGQIFVMINSQGTLWLHHSLFSDISISTKYEILQFIYIYFSHVRKLKSTSKARKRKD